MSRDRKHKRRGHFCWVCGRNRANERFSGRGHQRHVCKDCSQLGPDELVYLQGVRDIDQTLDWNGLIRRKRKRSFQRFLSDPNPRIRAYALEVQARDRAVREEFRNAILQDELDLEALVDRFYEESRAGLAPAFDVEFGQLTLAEGFAEWSEDDALAEAMFTVDPERDAIQREGECDVPF